MNTVTEAQVNYINRLQAERRWEDIPALEQQVQDARFAWHKGQFSKRDASLLIHNLDLASRRETAAPVANLEGMHRTSDGRIFKVQRAVHGSGNLYAKELLPIEEDQVEVADGEWKTITTFRFEYAKGALRLLSDATRMTLEQAKEFGTLYGTCCSCGRTLTDEGSIAAGIGPVCASKF